jgi:hypothetical protein
MPKLTTSPKRALPGIILFCLACDTTGPEIGIGLSEIRFGYTGIAYTGRLSGHGAAGPFEWTLIKGAVPGLTLSPDGYFIGTPTAEGEWPIRVGVTANNRHGTRDLKIRIYGNPPLILPDTLPHATVGVFYEVEVRFQGGISNSFRRNVVLNSGVLPAGLTLESRTPPPQLSHLGPYYIAGVPQATGVSEFTLRAWRGISEPIDTAYRAYRFTVVSR